MRLWRPCDATRIALRAAELGLSLDTLEVTADSVDDDRGLFGMDGAVRAGSMSQRTRVKIGAAGVKAQTLSDSVSYVIAHSPVADGCRAETPSTVEVTIACRPIEGDARTCRFFSAIRHIRKTP